MKTTKHYLTDRKNREALIKKIGEGREIAKFTVDRNHKNGPEIHVITDTGIIIIKNKKTKKLITKLIARPNQIKRYFETETEEITKILKIAEKHQQMKYNLA